MSTVERNKGKLFPVKEPITDPDILDDPEEYGYVNIDGKFYKVKWEVEREYDCSYFSDVKKTKSGVIHFHTLHYNGGAHWTELVEEGLREIEDASN